MFILFVCFCLLPIAVLFTFFPFVYKFVCIFPGNSSPQDKTGFEFQRISIDRTKMSEEEAFEHAIEMIQTRQMGFRKAADFFSVSLFLGFIFVWVGLGLVQNWVILGWVNLVVWPNRWMPLKWFKQDKWVSEKLQISSR